MAHFTALSTTIGKQLAIDMQIKWTNSSWDSHKNWEKKYIPSVLLHNSFPFLSLQTLI